MKYCCCILLPLLICLLCACYPQQPAEEGITFKTFMLARADGDTARMLDIIRQQEQPGASLDSIRQLDVYYTGMAVYYQRQEEWQQAVHWLRKARPHVNQVFPWYLQISQSLLEAGDYSELLLYTDSIRMTAPSYQSLGNSPYFDLRGQALVHLGRRQEAFDWYTKATEEIENYSARNGKNSYSLIQLRTIYHAALLHHQQGQTTWAIRHLEQMQIDRHLRRFAFTLNVPGNKQLLVDCYHLLNECYQATGQLQDAVRTLQKIDSIQLYKINNAKETGANYQRELLRNEVISYHLACQQKAVAHARQTQHILYAAILFLLAVIVAGLLAWRHHRRRLRQLYEVLMEQHTAWLQAHAAENVSQPGVLPQPIESASEKSNAPKASDDSAAGVRQPSPLFLRILHLMDTQKPYRDPAFDLLALAHLAATNRSQLSALINRETPNGFSYWLAEYRVNDLIRQTELFPDKNMDELYTLSGFPSRTTFFRQFRQVTGLTPKQYKTQRTRSCTIKSE